MQTIQAPTTLQSKQNTIGGSDKTNLILLTGACLLVFFVALGSWGFIDPGDGYFSEASREMIERGNYIVPYLNYQIYFSKPVLIYWLIISSYHIFGINEFAARFPSAALATAAVLTCYWTTRSLFTRRAGLFAGLVLATSPLVVTFARMSLIDMGFASLLGIALCSTALTLMTDSRRWWPVIYASLGLATLDKGPAAIVIYIIAMLGYAAACKPNMQIIKDACGRLRLLPGLVLFTAIAVPWYVAVGIATHGLWPQVFFFFENFGRFTGHTNHKVPYFWFYLPVLAYGFFPWVLFLPAALWQPIKSCWHRWRSGGTVSGASPANAELLFCCWSLATLLFFSASMTKLQTYVLPAWPAMAVLVGVVLDRWFERPDESRRRYLYGCAQLLGLLGMAMMIVTLAALAFAVNPAQMATLVPAPVSIKLARLADSIDNWQRAAIVGCAGVTAVGFLISWRRLQLDEPRRGITALFATCMAADAIGSPVAYQLGYRYKNADVHAVVQSIRNEPGLVALYHDFKPSVIFHLKRPVDTFFSVDQLRRRTTQNDPHQRQYIIAAGKGASELLSAYPADLRVIARSGNWSVMATDSLVAVRLPTLEQSFTQHIDLSGGEYSWGTLPFAGGTKPPRL